MVETNPRSLGTPARVMLMLAVVNKRQSRATYGDGQKPSRGCSNYRWRTPARQIANLAMTKIVGFLRLSCQPQSAWLSSTWKSGHGCVSKLTLQNAIARRSEKELSERKHEAQNRCRHFCDHVVV